MPKTTLLYSADACQKTLLARKDDLTKGMFIPKIKNKLITAKPQVNSFQRGQQFNLSSSNKENENPILSQTASKPAGIISRSKKIQKTSPQKNLIQQSILQHARQALSDISNVIKPQINESEIKALQLLMSKKKKSPEFLEDALHQDKPQPVTSNYIKLNYMNCHSRKIFTFYCFQEKELKFDQRYAEKTIQHTCDNDCTTDEDQIKGAKKNLQRQLENHLKEVRELELKKLQEQQQAQLLHQQHTQGGSEHLLALHALANTTNNILNQIIKPEQMSSVTNAMNFMMNSNNLMNMNNSNNNIVNNNKPTSILQQLTNSNQKPK